jgi:hypothetical protein
MYFDWAILNAAPRSGRQELIPCGQDGLRG